MPIPLDLDPVLKAVEIAAILGSTATLLFKIGRTTERFEQVGRQQAVEISGLRSNIDKLNVLFIEQASAKTRADNHADRLNAHDRRFEIIDHRLDELRRGEGLIVKGAA
jgi:hypothetical protein